MAQPDTLRFSLLGPVRAWRGSTEVDVGTPGEQAVLAMLLLSDGRPRDVAGLVAGCWGADPPRSAAGTVRAHIARLRAGFGAAASTHGGPDGFALLLPDGALDVAAAEQDVLAAQHTTDLAHAADLLRAALARWVGDPLAGVPGPYAQDARDRLTERRLRLLADRLDVDLRRGRHEDVVGELTQLCDEYPLREEFRALLMLALYRAGRPSEALAGYADTAKVLAAEYGLDPGRELTALHERITRHDETLLVAEPTPRPVTTQPTTQHTARVGGLPGEPADFSGRFGVVAELTDALGDGCAVLVSAVPGAGATSVALRVAHRVRQRFPDGVLYADLRGADAAAVLGGLLLALGVIDVAIPADLDARAALYRSVLAERRVLVVLDHVADATQLRSLLPAAAGCAVLATSRARLDAPTARHVDIDVFSASDAVGLLARIIGPDRVAAQRSAALDLVRRCGSLPLSVRIVGARLVVRPDWPIEALTDRIEPALGGARNADSNAAGTAEGAVRLCYDLLDPVAARALRLLAVLDVADIRLGAAAAALDLPGHRAAQVLARLVDLALLAAEGARYRWHELPRSFARRESERVDPSTEHTAVLRRYLEFQLAAARAAAPGTGRDGGPARWTHELPSILVVLRQAAGHIELARLAADLLLALDPLLGFGSRWHDVIEPARAALALAEYARDPVACGRIGHMLGVALLRADRPDDAAAVVERAARVATVTRDTALLARIQHTRGLIMVRRRDFPAAIDRFDAAAELAAAAGATWDQVAALLNLATTQARAAAAADALIACQRALTLLVGLADPFAEGCGLCTHGRVLRRSGEFDTAIGVFLRGVAVARANRLPVIEIIAIVEIAGCHLAAGRQADALAWAEQARAAAARVGWARVEAEALTVLGRALAGLGEPERSQSCLRRAHTIFVRLGLPDADDLRPLLSGVW